MNKYKKRRLEKGLSVLALSKKSGVCRETIKRIESGTSNKPYDSTISKLEKVLFDEKQNDIVQIGDLVRFSNENMQDFVVEISVAHYGMKAFNFGYNEEYEPSAIYKPNKKGDYICVWRRENEEH